MDFRELSYLTAIAKYQNITKAAEALFISQPGLSKFLTNLENDLGLKLFERVDKKYLATYAGERYLNYARNILETKASLDAELADIIKRDVGVLDVGIPNMRCTYILPKVLPVFNKRYPNVNVNIFEGTSTAIDKRLLDGDLDIAFYSKPHELNQALEYQTLATEELLICTCKDHPIKNFSRNNPASSYKKIDLSILKNERLILLSTEQRTGQISRYYLKQAGINFSNNPLTINNMPAIIDLTEAGYGVSFIFDSHLRYHLPVPEIDCYSFGEPKITSDFTAAFRKKSYMTKYARDFISMVADL